jgi:hypothetical protein
MLDTPMHKQTQITIIIISKYLTFVVTGAHHEETVITEEDQPDDLIGQ